MAPKSQVKNTIRSFRVSSSNIHGKHFVTYLAVDLDVSRKAKKKKIKRSKRIPVLKYFTRKRP